MITLGINAAFHDSAAALVIDGACVAATEEERFTRIKHAKRPLPFSAWELPYHAIDFCLKQAGLGLGALDHVAYSYDPKRFLGDRVTAGQTSLALPLEPSAHDSSEWENPWDPLFAAYIVNAPRQFADGWPHHLRRSRAGRDGHHRWHFIDHHLCHQASAFLAAPFPRSAVMTLDGRGEHATTSYGVYRDGAYRSLGEVCMPHSLGMLYERVTSHLGFLHSSDEYKVMALAALGRPVHRGLLGEQVKVGDAGRFTIAPFDMTALFGPPRARGTPLEQRHFDLAASLQAVLEETAHELAAWLAEASGERQLAMAGGVALNCVMNSKLRDCGLFDAVWVQPAAGDAGTALGAALWVDACGGEPAASGPSAATPLAARRWQMNDACLGPAHDEAGIAELLDWSRLDYTRPGDLADATAQLLAEGCIVGWFQGRMEFGPRALGARSILASPIDPRMQARLNELKDREDFRPVAPAIAEEHLAEWFAPAAANGGVSPFMLFLYDVLPGRSERIPSACHTDRTARVQTVSRATNPRFHALLEAFARITGVPVLVNTSFNVRGEPIVCTPKDAIQAFWSTPLDALAIGPFLLRKRSSVLEP